MAHELLEREHEHRRERCAGPARDEQRDRGVDPDEHRMTARARCAAEREHRVLDGRDREHEHARELVSAFGSKGVPAEQVAREACAEARTYLESGAPVGQHLADQLVLLFALAGGGRLRTLPLTLHTETQLELIPRFLGVEFSVTPCPGGVEVSVARSG